jgi:hypothetical protein
MNIRPLAEFPTASRRAIRFAYFAHSAAVANIRPFLPRLKSPPVYVTESVAGDGFVEFAAILRS